MRRWLSYYIFRTIFAGSIFFLEAGAQTNYPGATDRLSDAIRFQTFSSAGKPDIKAYTGFLSWLANAYPLATKHLEKKLVNDYSYLLHWKGSDSLLKPVLLVAHYDVVPVENPNSWSYPPFSGTVDSGFVWGRGTLDDKGELISLMEAVETLLAEKFIPARSIYIAIGHDEENGGMEGAAKIANLVREKNLSFEFILDEGGAIMKNVFPGLEKQIAFVATAEKGYADFSLQVITAGGHSSVPATDNAIEILSHAITRIKAKSMKARLQPPVTSMLKSMAPYLDKKSRFGIRHMKLFKRKLLKTLASNEATNSLIRTSLTPTMFYSGTANNVLPSEASVNINARILGGETVASVYEYLKETVNDERVRITISAASHEPSPVSDVGIKSWEILKETILTIFPDVVTSPVLSPAMSDSRHYLFASRNVYRFSPITLSTENKEQIHGLNERIAIHDYYQAIGFYKTFIRKLR